MINTALSKVSIFCHRSVLNLKCCRSVGEPFSFGDMRVKLIVRVNFSRSVGTKENTNQLKCFVNFGQNTI